MSVNQLISELMDQGIDLACDGDQLRVRAPKGTVTAEVKSRLKAEKLQILTVLQATKIHRIHISELRKLAGGDWQEIQNNPGQLEAFAHAVSTRRMRESGQRPAHYTKTAECERCGPIWLWEGAPDMVQGCPWCFNNDTPIPRPAPVQCRDCRHWIPDTINPAGGLGQCEKNVPGLAWPWRKLECSQYRTSLLPSVV